MGPDDTFQLIAFDSTTESMSPASLPNSAANIAAAERWLGTLAGRRRHRDALGHPRRARPAVRSQAPAHGRLLHRRLHRQREGDHRLHRHHARAVARVRLRHRLVGEPLPHRGRRPRRARRRRDRAPGRAGRRRGGAPVPAARPPRAHRRGAALLRRRRDGARARAHARSVRRPAAGRRRQVSRPRARDGRDHRPARDQAVRAHHPGVAGDAARRRAARHLVGAAAHRDAHRRHRERRRRRSTGADRRAGAEVQADHRLHLVRRRREAAQGRHPRAARRDPGAERAARGRLVQGHLRRAGRAGQRGGDAGAGQAGRSRDPRAAPPRARACT